ncbi:MAG: hypothetical protein JW993_01580 [Sedimentisphaerales bacterium]|nr:hypothetical protein [Sedimentisphaerales bacterium]
MALRSALCALRLSPSCFAPVACCFLAASLFVGAGCESPPAKPPAPSQPIGAGQATAAPQAPAVTSPSGFGPAGIEVLPLTELVQASGPDQGTQLNVYVSLLDAFGSKIKAPVVLRFELYDYVQRSAEPKGQRIAIWPDIDLTNPAENHAYWQDFLRCYAFDLATQAARGRTYIVEATCMCAGGRRLSTDFMLRPDN